MRSGSTPAIVAVVGILLATVPGLLAWYWGRQVARHVGDPLFAERFWSYRRHVVTATTLVSMLGGLSLGLGLARVAVAVTFAIVLVAGLLFASFLTRRRVFDETWSFATFAIFRLRLVLAFAGFWVALVTLPSLVIAAGPAKPVASVTLFVVMMLWRAHFPRVAAWMSGGRPIADPDINERLTRLVARTALARPVLVQVGPPGGVFANALAVPSLRGNMVILFTTLLERFSPSEVEAVMAHELAHLEQFDTAFLRRYRVVIVALIALGAGVVPYLTPWLGAWALVLWLVSVVAALASFSRGSKDRETQGDLRAAELTGGAEAMISALIRLHTMGHVPRRLDATTEAGLTHPALARRIQALRDRAPGGRATLRAGPVIVAGAAGEFLVFEPERVRHLRDVTGGETGDLLDLVNRAGRTEAFPRERLASVHLAPVAGGADLVVQGPSKTLVRMRVPQERVAAVQTLLDQLDLKLAEPSGVPGHLVTVRVAALLALLSYLAVGPALFAQALVASLGSSPRAAAALGTGAGVVALLLATNNFDEPWFVGLVAVIALVTWWAAIRWRRAAPEEGPRARLELSILVAWTILSVALLGLNGLDVVRLGQRAADFPSALAAVVSLAAWLWFAPGRPTARAQAGVLAALLAALAVALVGTTWFVDAFSRDALLASPTKVGSERFARVDFRLVEAFAPIVVERPGELRLSPGGVTFASMDWCDRSDALDRCHRRRVHIGDSTGIHRSLDATDVRFLDDERLVVLRTADGSAVVSTETSSGPFGEWAVTLPSGQINTLIVDGPSGRWVASGDEPRERRRVVYAGTVGDPRVVPREFAIPSDGDRFTEWLVDDSFIPVGVETHYEFDGPAALLSLRSWLLPQTVRTTSSLVAQSGDPVAVSSLDLKCFHAQPARRGIPCFAGDGRRTHVWIVHPGESRLEPAGWLDSRSWAHWPPAADRWVLSSGRCTWRVLDLARREVGVLPLGRAPCPSDVAISATRVAAFTYESGESILRVYDFR